MPEALINERASLEEIAMLSMEVARLRMECGASARVVNETAETVALGLGAERVDLRIGYASLAITIGRGGDCITRMRKVGALGVNQRFDHLLRGLARTVARTECSAAAARAQLRNVAQNSPRHRGWLVDIAVGVACAAFGRLLGVDWVAMGPVSLGAAVGQWFRRQLAVRQVNTFIAATMVAFIASVVSGLGARFLGSLTVDTAMLASVLLLVPGVPSLNAQNDILEGHPTLGSARAVWVLVTLMFLTVGIWVGQTLIGEWRVASVANSPAMSLERGAAHILHQTVCGGLAAIGFGVLFNMAGPALLWCGAGGALALAVRSAGSALGWTLEGSSFAAALAVGSGVQVFHKTIGVSRNTLAAASCIPMIPGGVAAKALLGLIILTRPAVLDPGQTLTTSVQDALRVIFTIGAMGTGLAIPSMLLRTRRAPEG